MSVVNPSDGERMRFPSVQGSEPKVGVRSRLDGEVFREMHGDSGGPPRKSRYASVCPTVPEIPVAIQDPQHSSDTVCEPKENSSLDVRHLRKLCEVTVDVHSDHGCEGQDDVCIEECLIEGVSDWGK